jgi:hypothetical protein
MAGTSDVRRRAEGLQRAMECALLKPDAARYFDDARRQLRAMYGDDVTEDEIDMAGRKVLAHWRQQARSHPGAQCHLATAEANWRAINLCTEASRRGD